jgi:tripartite-type tricarboxylate transporter receptor subunit TctC
MAPYERGAAAATDLAAGRISMLLDSQLALQGLQPSGRVRVLGVASEKPSAVFPEFDPQPADVEPEGPSVWVLPGALI